MSEAPASVVLAPPRVFVVRGDLLDLACDHLLIPTDRARLVASYWHDHLRMVGVEIAQGIAFPEGEAERDADRRRVHGPFSVLSGAGEAPQTTWLLAATDAAPDARTPASGRDLEPLDEALAHFRGRYLEHGRAHPPERASSTNRPVIAMPLLGSGQGGFRQRMRAYARELMDRLATLAADLDADVVVVVQGADQRAAAWLETCRRALRESQDDARSAAAKTDRPLGQPTSAWCVAATGDARPRPRQRTDRHRPPP